MKLFAPAIWAAERVVPRPTPKEPPGQTPGVNAARAKGLRPLSGRSVTCLLEITWPSEEVSLSIITVLSFTVMLSES